ncbi:hypothetical protein [Bradyrhizobium sp. SYSU BS000235]|uniref:hypothetical protein n=1 Tax=Bradyrhizobium sp. SYSU BS000235 TaxID=3411332 RepID=UPI003C775EAC
MNISPEFNGKRCPERPGRNSPLIDYALHGLQQCWMPDLGRWSHIYHLDGRPQPNESVPHSDVFYTLNVLLGLSRVKHVPEQIDRAAIFEQNVSLLPNLPVRDYAYGMALWTAAESGFEIPGDIARHIDKLLSDRDNWRRFKAQDLGMLLTGVIAQLKAGEERWRKFAQPLFSFLAERYHSKSGLFFDASVGYRRRFASFATQTYLTLACFHYGEFTGDRTAIAMARSCTRDLISLQGPRGEWPWFFDAAQGQVLDFYEVYSVHQYGMAPAFLELAERHDVPVAKAALIKGFRWVLGHNQLQRSMLVPELHLSIRSQVRGGELRTNKLRMIRAVQHAYLPRPARLIDSANVALRMECRSYELGWILWSFGQRVDLTELTHAQEFTKS